MAEINLEKFWLTGAKRDRKIAVDLFRLKHYHMALFIWQLVLEKMLKSKLAYQGKDVFPTHNLLALARKAEIKLTRLQEKQLSEISRFNIEARYDSIKYKFYKQATKEYAVEWVRNCSNLLDYISDYDKSS